MKSWRTADSLRAREVGAMPASDSTPQPGADVRGLGVGKRRAAALQETQEILQVAPIGLQGVVGGATLGGHHLQEGLEMVLVGDGSS